MFVYMAQQIFGDKSGAERKKIVKQALTDALQNSGIEMTDQFVDDMIEAAVKGLRIAESARTVTVNTEITSESGKDG